MPEIKPPPLNAAATKKVATQVDSWKQFRQTTPDSMKKTRNNSYAFDSQPAPLAGQGRSV
jgi:hypothetical protein